MIRVTAWLQIRRAPDILRVVVASASIVVTAPATATRAGPAEQIRSAAVAADGKSIALRFIDGRSNSFMVDDPETTFGPPRLSPDHHVVGWVDFRRDGASYASPVGVSIYARGRHISIGCDGGAPSAWRFNGSDRVVLKCAFPHGPPSTSLQQVVISTGKVVGRVELSGEDDAIPAMAPTWAQSKFPKDN